MLRPAPAPSPARPSIRPAFTLLELMVAVVVLAVLAAVAYPSFRSVVSRSEDAAAQQSARAILLEADALMGFGDSTWEEALAAAMADLVSAPLLGVSAGGGLAPVRDDGRTAAAPGQVVWHTHGPVAGVAIRSAEGRVVYARLKLSSHRVVVWVASRDEYETRGDGVIAVGEVSDPFNQPPGVWADSFSGTGLLGLSEVGRSPWLTLSGSWERTGIASTSSVPSSNPVALLDMLRPDVSVLSGVASGGGDAVVVRASDGDSLVRARVHHDSVERTDVVVTPASCTVGSWGSWVFVRNVNSKNPVESTTPSRYGRDACSSYHSRESRVTYTSSCACWQELQRDRSLSAVKEVSQTTSTRVQVYEVVLERLDDGVVTVLGRSPASINLNLLEVRAVGETISVFLDRSPTPSISVVESFNSSATLHGIGRTSSRHDGTNLDGFYATWVRTP